MRRIGCRASAGRVGTRPPGWRLAAAAAAAMALAAGGLARPAAAQPAPSAAGTTLRLIELLIQNGVLTREQAEGLVRQAQAEAAAAARAPRAAPTTAGRAAPAAAPTAAAAAVTPEAAEPPPGTIRIPYVPEVVRRQIRDEVRQDLAAELRRQGRAAGPPAGTRAEWTDRIRLYGDVRLRGEAFLYPKNNAAGFFPNVMAINNGSAFDLNGTANAPFLNVDQDRTRFRLRARIGIEAQVNDWITADFRIATGNDSSPVSANQTFGAVSSAAQQYGFFSKYAIWLDRAYVRMRPSEWLQVDAGRMPNPFRSTDLLYHVDLGMDGLAARASQPLAEGLSGYITAGAFPYFNTDLNFSTTDIAKSPSRDRYMVGAQLGADWRPTQDWGLNVNLGYYNFLGAEGALSAPCAVPYAADACNTDITRAFFTQNTNTFFPLRNLVPNPANPAGPAPQFFGLASRFEVLDLYARLDYAGFAPYLVTFEANYLNNLGFDRDRILRRGILANGAANGIINNIGNGNRFIGGGQGYMLRLTLGHRDVAQLWDWNAFVAYRYLESDAVIDAFTDTDFRLGGTNSRGYILGGTLGIARNAALRLRWFSGEEVAGPPLRSDLLQFDLLARF